MSTKKIGIAPASKQAEQAAVYRFLRRLRRGGFWHSGQKWVPREAMRV
jgi:hypothetical protein